ncbi:hypothetical protein [Vreelandella titanicae]|uniref:hypothetical protein n=1 Tax=Vreelandella titanicae TaxID=664683 RepID=UPI001376329C|nr:hypothetical protein [Halomonas titanicae]NVE90194.1 hypothetical protein [Halomonas titanicae]
MGWGLGYSGQRQRRCRLCYQAGPRSVRQPDSGPTFFCRVVVMPLVPADAIAGHHEILASTNQIE